MEEFPVVLDLFCGMGGFSLGFTQEGFPSYGVDKDPHCVSTYRWNIGQCLEMDLRAELPDIHADVVIAGPPCRPWSRLNRQRRGINHPDRSLLVVFQEALLEMKPLFFILENVPPLTHDPIFPELVRQVAQAGYSWEYRTLCYADFGAATARRRLFLFGSRVGEIQQFIKNLTALRDRSRTVGEVLTPYSEKHYGEVSDHVWPSLRTIEKYKDKYQTGKYGWYRLRPDLPALSFGNIYKTYTLHPSAWDGMPPRVLSVREALAITGFNDTFSFPPVIPLTAKYRMVADAVSPVFSRRCAHALLVFLGLSE